MSKLPGIFQKSASTSGHPVLSFIESQQPMETTITVKRDKDLIGYKPAQLYLSFKKNGTAIPPQPYPWDPDLNDALVKRGIKAETSENEQLRFALSLRAKLNTTVSRFGDGFYNAVLVDCIKQLNLDQFPDVADILQDVLALKASRDGAAYSDCVRSITAIFATSGQELLNLGYSQSDAETVLAGAVAKYLDERFTVTDRRRLGWVAAPRG